MILSLPYDIQKNLIERCPQLNFVCKSLRLQKFTKPEDLCYPTRENDKEKIVIVEHIETIEGQKEGIKGILRRIEEYMERDNVRSLNTNSIELYNAIWNDIEKLHNHPNKKNIIKNWKYGGAYDYAFSQSSFETYETRLRFFYNFVMYIHH